MHALSEERSINNISDNLSSGIVCPQQNCLNLILTEESRWVKQMSKMEYMNEPARLTSDLLCLKGPQILSTCSNTPLGISC